MPRRAMVQKSAEALVTSTSDFLSAAPARRGASAVPATIPAASGNSSRRFILIPLIRASPRAPGPGSPPAPPAAAPPPPPPPRGAPPPRAAPPRRRLLAKHHLHHLLEVRDVVLVDDLGRHDVE